MDPPPVDISGRWGMFTFEDPVGVQLVQASDGTLTGTGCVAGAPGAIRHGSPSNTPDAWYGWCGKIDGEVKNRSASFGFTFSLGRYSTRVTVSEDGRRMAGVVHLGEFDFHYPGGWLRVADDADWLAITDPRVDADPAVGTYDLRLVAADSQGSEFQSGTTYTFGYHRDGIWGDLGAFWNTEIGKAPSAPAAGQVPVGPVPPTLPGLPISLSLDVDGGTILGVIASTASGGRYVFAAARPTP